VRNRKKHVKNSELYYPPGYYKQTIDRKEINVSPSSSLLPSPKDALPEIMGPRCEGGKIYGNWFIVGVSLNKQWPSRKTRRRRRLAKR
jgi:hypothetical protein